MWFQFHFVITPSFRLRFCGLDALYPGLIVNTTPRSQDSIPSYRLSICPPKFNEPQHESSYMDKYTDRVGEAIIPICERALGFSLCKLYWKPRRVWHSGFFTAVSEVNFYSPLPSHTFTLSWSTGNHHLIWHLLNSTASCVFIYRHLSLYLAASSSYSRLPGSSAFSVTLSQISLGSDLGMGFVNTFTTIWSNLTYGCLPLRLLWAIWLVEDMEHVVINEES